MSVPDQDKLLGIPKQDIIRWSLVLFMILVGVGSLLDGGALSSSYGKTAIIVYTSLFVLSYIGIVAGMFALGLEPSKFEMVFVPTLLLGMIVTVLSFTNLLPSVEDDMVGNGTSQSASTDALDFSNLSSLDSGNTQIIVTSYVTVNNPSLLETLLESWGPTLMLILFLSTIVVIVYIFLKRQNTLPELSFGALQEYAQSDFERNKSIIEYYVLTSSKIEELKGKAPQWFTPTFFSSQVQLSPGPPLSSYFNSLTNLYELARFSNREMSEIEVNDAYELHQQIILQLDEFIRKYVQEEKS